MVFPGVMYGYEIWTIKKQVIDMSLSKLWDLVMGREVHGVAKKSDRTKHLNWSDVPTLCYPIEFRIQPWFQIRHQPIIYRRLYFLSYFFLSFLEYSIMSLPLGNWELVSMWISLSISCLELLSILMYSFISFVKFGYFSAFFVVVQVFLLSALL